MKFNERSDGDDAKSKEKRHKIKQIEMQTANSS